MSTAFRDKKMNEAAPTTTIAGVILSQYLTVAVATAFVAADTFDLFTLPKGAVPIGGYFALTDMDTGVETLDIDIGIVANGVDAADPDFFTNAGLLTGDAITDLPQTNGTSLRLFTGAFPVVMLGADTTVQAKVNAIAATFAAGSMTIRVDYLFPGKSTS